MEIYILMLFLWIIGHLYTWGYADDTVGFFHYLWCLLAWPYILGTVHIGYMRDMANKK